MSFEYDNDKEICSQIESEIDEIITEISPLVPNNEKWKYSRDKSNEIMRNISPMIDAIKDQADKDINNLIDQIYDLKYEIDSLREENQEMKSVIEDLKMRIEQPGKWHGKKFGL